MLVQARLNVYARARIWARSIIELQAASSTVNGTTPKRSSAGLKFPWESSKQLPPYDVHTGVEAPRVQTTVGA